MKIKTKVSNDRTLAEFMAKTDAVKNGSLSIQDAMTGCGDKPKVPAKKPTKDVWGDIMKQLEGLQTLDQQPTHRKLPQTRHPTLPLSRAVPRNLDELESWADQQADIADSLEYGTAQFQEESLGLSRTSQASNQAIAKSRTQHVPNDSWCGTENVAPVRTLEPVQKEVQERDPLISLSL